MKIYENAQDLWPALIDQAGLDVKDNAAWWRRYRIPRIENQDSYDSGLLYDLRASLFPGATGSLQSLLKAAAPPLSAEKLLRAFFATLRPFSMMKQDILEMMSAARARKGDDNIKVRFQLNESDAPLDLLLNEFRDQMETVERCIVVAPVRRWTTDELWRIARVAEERLPERHEIQSLASPADRPIVDWIGQSRSTRRFESFPSRWRTGQDDLDRRLDVIVNLLDDISSAFRRYGSDYRSARDEMERLERSERGAASGVDRGEEGLVDPIGFTLRQLYFLESDFWLAAVGEWLLAVRIAVRRAGTSDAIAGAVISELDDILPAVTGSTREREEIIRQLTDILNLPVWKKRHAVYAVWIGSQIWQALKERWHFTFHLDGDVLSFAFSGVHLATLSNPRSDEVLAWWTEFRTPAAGLPSGHRSQAIQPDYRIRRAPFSASDADVLVVEVKQYKRSSTANFSAALTDYAYACQKAGVLLANYGPISGRVFEALPNEYRRRIAVTAFVRPDKTDNCLAFHAQIRRFVRVSVGDAQAISAASIGKVELKWNAHPEDLDLHLFAIEAAEQEAHICFSQREHGESIRLTGDIRDGLGPEALFFHRTTGKWLVCVNQFSDDGSLSSSGATINVFSNPGGTEKIVGFDCPNSGAGKWWIVCELDFGAGLVSPINYLAESPDLPG
jgi:hypothetical protein